MKSAFKINFFEIFILFGIFLVPLVWSKYLNANYVSAKFFLVYFISALSLLVSSRKLILPKLPKTLMYSFILLGALHAISPAVSQSWLHFYYIFKFLSFIFLAYFFYTIPIDLDFFLKKYDFIIVIVATFILVFAFNDFYIYRFEKLDTQSGFLLGSFGNVNMLAEFLILSLPLIHFWLRIKTSIHKAFKAIIFLGWIFFICYCRSRSAWLGLGMWTLWALSHKKFGMREALLLLLGITLYHISFLAPSIEAIATLAKQDSFSQRLHLYQSTLRLIKDYPIGVGVGQFITEIIPYLVDSEFRPMEYVFFDQPHSEILKWAVQFGWIGFFLPTIILVSLFIQALKVKNFFLTSSFLVLLPQIGFQFPFENPASLVYLAFLFAFCLQGFGVAKEFLLPLKKRMIFFIFSFVGVAHSLAYVSSIFFETSHNNNIDLVLYSCDVYPINVNACFNRNHFLMVNNNYVQTRLSISQSLRQFPFHAGLLRLFPIYLKNSFNDKSSCEGVLMYNSIFMDQKFFSKEVIESCNPFKIPVTFKDPKQFRSDYLAWQGQFLK